MKSGQATTRTCKKCGEIKPILDFPIYDKKTEARRHACNKCNDARVDAHHQTNKVQRLARAAERYRADPSAYWTPARRARANELAKVQNAALRRTVLSHYGTECQCCGEREPMFLTIDHVQNDGAMRRKEHGTGSAFYRWLIKSGFPSDFQTLCMNCNFGKARNGGICPHHGLGKLQRLSLTGVRRKRSAAEALSTPLVGVDDIVSSASKDAAVCSSHG